MIAKVTIEIANSVGIMIRHLRRMNFLMRRSVLLASLAVDPRPSRHVAAGAAERPAPAARLSGEPRNYDFADEELLRVAGGRIGERREPPIGAGTLWKFVFLMP